MIVFIIVLRSAKKFGDSLTISELRNILQVPRDINTFLLVPEPLPLLDF